MATAAVGAAVVSPLPASADGRAAAGLVTVGEAARRSGFTIKAVRFYERRGLLPPSGRSPGGYRLYDEADLEGVALIPGLLRKRGEVSAPVGTKGQKREARVRASQ